MLNVDDLPAPFGPNNPNISLSFKSNEIPFTALTLPESYILPNYLASITTFLLSFS
jgi:hypothetical protein